MLLFWRHRPQPKNGVRLHRHNHSSQERSRPSQVTALFCTHAACLHHRPSFNPIIRRSIEIHTLNESIRRSTNYKHYATKQVHTHTNKQTYQLFQKKSKTQKHIIYVINSIYLSHHLVPEPTQLTHHIHQWVSLDCP